MGALPKALMNIVLAESSLETVPRELWSHPVIVRDSKRRGRPPWRILLDKARHYHAMGTLPRKEKRGRPDIVHMSMLVALYSPLALSGTLRLYVHTIADRVIYVGEGVRIPKNYNNFVGLMEQLFSLGKAPPNAETPLLRVEHMTLDRLLDSFGDYVVMHERGRRLDLGKLADLAMDRTVVVGGFPHGDYDSPRLRDRDRWVRVGDTAIDAWQVVERIVVAVEAKLGLI